jgi:hypothetical protein
MYAAFSWVPLHVCILCSANFSTRCVHYQSRWRWCAELCAIGLKLTEHGYERRFICSVRAELTLCPHVWQLRDVGCHHKPCATTDV